MVVLPGETETDVPDPINVPPQLPLYHCQEEPDPNDPPDKLKVVDEPLQIDEGLEVALVAETDKELTVNTTALEVVLPQPFVTMHLY